jgi:hypothetical protein
MSSMVCDISANVFKSRQLADQLFSEGGTNRTGLKNGIVPSPTTFDLVQTDCAFDSSKSVMSSIGNLFKTCSFFCGRNSHTAAKVREEFTDNEFATSSPSKRFRRVSNIAQSFSQRGERTFR